MPSAPWVYKVVSTSLRNPVHPPLGVPQVRERKGPTGGKRRDRDGPRGVTAWRKACRALLVADACANATGSLERKGDYWAGDTPVCANLGLRSRPFEKKNMFFSIDF